MDVARLVLFLHIIGAVAMGFYLVVPFVVGKIGSLSNGAKEGTLSAIGTLNRYAQIGLVIQLLTGGYLISEGNYSVAWMIVVFILFLAIAAIGGMMGKPLRTAITAIRSGSAAAEVGRLRGMSSLLAICLLLILFFMVYRHII
ncbi:hypothetical protein Q5741_06680 [Paenibacillus sp. JX-17]|uniref:DUF2269 family protein n=1 Tax=Paenibacillus lacisoli TaxID=3064525 RepID=A0ABT9CES4_9BACL|nr:hypothetical protein [Paenibacillus sp. JX-17]MDO7906103.1 hypothetical protein [Paenibacillus sp. JX-17]